MSLNKRVLNVGQALRPASLPREYQRNSAAIARAPSYGPDMDGIQQSVDELAKRTGFSGAVRVDNPTGTLLAVAYGFAHRAHHVANTVDTRFAIASGVKGMTALTIAGLIRDGLLSFDTTARAVLGSELPLIDDEVTVEHLLAHRSGIGDYLNEGPGLEITDYVLPVPVHELASTEQYLRVLDGHRQVFRPGEKFAYCNAGYVVLALLAERCSSQPFPELLRSLVCEPAGLSDTAFLRNDELPTGTATGYLTQVSPRSNVLHLPVVGSGDGGIYSTVADQQLLWDALFSGRILTPQGVEYLVRPRSDVPAESARYGLGFWLHPTTSAVRLEGYDAGVSFRSVHNPDSGLTYTVVSNTSEGAWPIARHLAEVLEI